MDKLDYAQMFDLKPEESSLHILICAKDKLASGLPNAEFISADTLPRLPFQEQSFELILCPNVLFIENFALTEDFHQQVLMELSRVGTEVRIFPLVNQLGQPSQYLGSLLQVLQEKGLGIELRQIQTKPEKAANAMLRLWNAACVVNA